MTVSSKPTDLLRADFSRREVVDTNQIAWLASPKAGVDRRMLDRIGDEVARATTIVRYVPASSFPAHTHGAGEEFLVLDGVFSDEHGDYPTGTYVRNPPGSQHTPRTDGGCTIFVKLRQMREDDVDRVVVAPDSLSWRPTGTEGYERAALFSRADGSEDVTMERLAKGASTAPYVCDGGEEILVINGTLEDEGGSYEPGTWLRSPDGHRHGLSSSEGCMFWVKRGHLTAKNPAVDA
ncbi:MAG: cupin domain-containing protein [Pseudomonadota bacterium]